MFWTPAVDVQNDSMVALVVSASLKAKRAPSRNELVDGHVESCAMKSPANPPANPPGEAHVGRSVSTVARRMSASSRCTCSSSAARVCGAAAPGSKASSIAPSKPAGIVVGARAARRATRHGASLRAQRTRTHTSDFRGGAHAAPSAPAARRRAADEERRAIGVDVPLKAVEVGIRVVLLQIVGGECPHHLLAQPVEAGARVGARRARVVEIVLADHGLVREEEVIDS